MFETVKVVNHVARLRSRCQSPGVPGSSPVSARSSRTSTPRTSYYGSDGASLQMDDKAPAVSQCEEQRWGFNQTIDLWLLLLWSITIIMFVVVTVQKHLPRDINTERPVFSFIRIFIVVQLINTFISLSFSFH